MTLTMLVSVALLASTATFDGGRGDVPAIRYRGGFSYGSMLRPLLNAQPTREAKLAVGRQAIDLMLRNGINAMLGWGNDDVARELQIYAQDSGMWFMDYPNAGKLCWCDDAAIEKRARDYAEATKKACIWNGIFIIHPTDGGSWQDPEFWSKRCEKCRAQYGDGERWKASAHVLNIFNRVLKEYFPNARVGSCIYPYMFNTLMVPEADRSAKWKESMPEYWSKLSAAIPDKEFFFLSWICSGSVFPELRRLMPDRDFAFSDTYPQSAGVFSTYHRKLAAVYEQGRGKYYFSHCSDSCGAWESMMLLAAYAANPSAPGCEVYDGGVFYDSLVDHTGPKAVMEVMLPKICRAFWGEELGPIMTEAMASGFQPKFLKSPTKTIEEWNRYRADPLYDPCVKKTSIVDNGLPPIEDTPQYRMAQNVSAAKFRAAIARAKPLAEKLDPVRKAYFQKLVGYAAIPDLPLVELPVIPKRTFKVTDYGAKADGSKSTAAFAAAIEACVKAGGGRVEVPAGTFFTGPIHLKSNVELNLDKDAVLDFSDDPADYLPAVPVSWEGMECLNYSPLVYAYGATNVALTGKGMLKPRLTFWRKWMGFGTDAQVSTQRELYYMAMLGIPIEQRDMTALKGSGKRPHLVHFNRSRNVLIDGPRLRGSPFWVQHLYKCDNCTVRNVDVRAFGGNNDSIDIEMTRNVLLEDCTFFGGDDAITLKAGRNAEGWRGRPTENVVARHIHVRFGHGMVACGSELSGGIRKVLVEDCTADTVGELFKIKTTPRRGGFVENVTVRNLRAELADHAFLLGYDYMGYSHVPDFELRDTKVKNILFENSSVGRIQQQKLRIGECKRTPAENVVIRNVTADSEVQSAVLPENGIVFDIMRNAARYENLSPRFKAAFDFLRRKDLYDLEPGKYPIDGEDVFAIISDVMLKPVEESVFEVHRKYADLQMTFGQYGRGENGGSVLVGYGKLPADAVMGPYDEANDVASGAKTVMPFQQICHDTFALILPGTPHAPDLTGYSPHLQRKVCIKIRMK